MKRYFTTSRLSVLTIAVLLVCSATLSQSPFWQATTGSSGEIIYFTTAADGAIYCSGVGGVYRSIDNGMTWARIFSNEQIVASTVAVNPKTGSIFVGTFNALYRSTNNGTDWSIINVNNGYGFEAVAITSQGIIVSSHIPQNAANPEILRSSDNGNTWKVRRLQGRPSLPVPHFAVSSSGFIYTSVYYGSIMYSRQNGIAWVRVRAKEIRSEPISHVWTTPTNEVFAGNLNSRIFRSSNNGRSWTKIFDRANPDAACFYPFLQGFTMDLAGNYYVSYMGDGVFRSTDRGTSWSLISDGLPSNPYCANQGHYTTSLTVIPDGHILVGTDQGVYRSTQTISPVQLPQYHTDDENVLPASFSLHQNYPNPFNPTTTIEFELASDALVAVKVYNILGQEVATLVDQEEFGEGTNELEFDGSSLPSGVYYYRIVAQDVETGQMQFTSVKKMLLVK